MMMQIAFAPVTSIGKKTMHDTFYLAGLPRTGSTLLCSLLNQHPDIYASATSGLSSLVESVKNTYSQGELFKSQDTDEMDSRIRFAQRGLISGWSIGDAPFYVDKGRGWTRLYPLLKALYDKPKVVVTVRDLRGIYASMEKLHRENTLINDPVTNPSDTGSDTVEARVRTWSTTLPVGTAINSLKDLIQKKMVDDILFIRYEDLVSNTQFIMNSVYHYFEVDEIEYRTPIINVTPENDRVLGIPGLHDIDPKIEEDCKDYEEVLGKGLSDQIFTDYTWYNEVFGYKR